MLLKPNQIVGTEKASSPLISHAAARAGINAKDVFAMPIQNRADFWDNNDGNVLRWHKVELSAIYGRRDHGVTTEWLEKRARFLKSVNSLWLWRDLQDGPT